MRTKARSHLVIVLLAVSTIAKAQTINFSESDWNPGSYGFLNYHYSSSSNAIQSASQGNPGSFLQISQHDTYDAQTYTLIFLTNFPIYGPLRISGGFDAELISNTPGTGPYDGGPGNMDVALAVQTADGNIWLGPMASNSSASWETYSWSDVSFNFNLFTGFASGPPNFLTGSPVTFGFLDYGESAGERDTTVGLDNLHFSVELVPEPFSSGIIALAILGVVVLRRRSHQ